MTTRNIPPDEVPFDYERAYGFLKIQKSSDKFEMMHSMVKKLYEEHRHLLKPRYRYEIYKVAGSQSGSFSILLDSGVSFVGKGIHTLLSHSRYAAVFLLTVGDAIDEVMKKIGEEDFTEAYFLDGIASTVTQGLLHLMKGDLQKEAQGLGCEVAYRFSPGYARWELQEQEKIFSLLKGGEIGMSLSDTYYMLPQKSLSGVYGLRPAKPE